jgi:hypothetical protein
MISDLLVTQSLAGRTGLKLLLSFAWTTHIGAVISLLLANALIALRWLGIFVFMELGLEYLSYELYDPIKLDNSMK